MRGKVPSSFLSSSRMGITPAYAGKRTPKWPCFPRKWDHPRVCGEKDSSFVKYAVCIGSPPRVRGKGEQTARPHYHMRITPACAGKRRLSAKTASRSRDHPRVCGEKAGLAPVTARARGSPPRVRGKGNDRKPGRRAAGITPACAGKSKLPLLDYSPAWDHPRVCGEKVVLSIFLVPLMGSPPRVRGKGLSFFSIISCFGITPACAGKRLKRSHSIGHFSCILCLFHSVLHRASVSGGSRAGPCAPPCLPAQNAVPV